MTVAEILRGKGSRVLTILPELSVHDAVQSLTQNSVGSLLVQDSTGVLLGIITERDVLRTCADRADQLRSIAIRDVMSRELIVAVTTDELEYVMGVMTKNRIRHMPIMDGPRIAGVISIGDVVKAMLDQTAFENRYLREYISAR